MRYTDLHPDIDPLTGHVSRDVHDIGLSAADTAAVEHALRIAEAWSGRVLVVTAGPDSVEDMLREMLALGADVLRIPWPPVDSGPAGSNESGLSSSQTYLDDLADDERSLARAVATAVCTDRARTGVVPAVVVCGDRSTDRGTGAFPAQLAHELGAAQALGLVSLEPVDGALLAERRLDGGRRERLRVPRPAVCSVEGAGVRLRRTSLPASIAARRATVPVAAVPVAAVPVAAVPVAAGRAAVSENDGAVSRAATVVSGHATPYRPRTRVLPPPEGSEPRQRLLALTGALVAHDPPTIIGPVSAGEAADALLAFLERNGYLAEPGANPKPDDGSGEVDSGRVDSGQVAP